MNWKDFFDSLGLNGTKWQWRIMRWERAWKDRSETARQRRSQVTYRHKFCSCGALLDRDERVCPHCGKRAPSWRAQVVSRAVGLVIPSALAVSSTLLIVNAMIFVLVVAIAGASALFAPPGELLVRMGSLVPVFVYQGEFSRLLTYGYLHAGIIHLAFNMFVLSQVGPMLEQEIGKARFFTLYTLALLGGAVARLIVSGPAPMQVVGASGAMFGLIGFGIAYAHSVGGHSALDLRNFFIRWAFYAFLFGFLVPRVDNTAHVGGFLVGLALGVLVERERVHRDRLTPVWGYAALLCLLLTLAAFVRTIVASMD